MASNYPGLELYIADGQVEEDGSGPGLLQCTIEGLTKAEKTFPCKFFYDEKGSEIFEKITELPEYYPTRCERQIIVDFSEEIAAICGQNSVVVELGSGSSSKTKILLEAFMKQYGRIHYVPIDISAEFLEKTSVELLKQYPETLRVTAVPGLYQKGIQYIKNSPEFRNKVKLVCFFGSSIGNFTREEAKEFLRDIGKGMGPNDKLLIGIDLKKEIPVLEAAYNDSQGVTADFNLNLLHRINKELGGNFQLEKFEHRSVWNEKEGRIEMRIYSKEKQTVNVSTIPLDIQFSEGEFIHTENCYKYSHEDIKDLASGSGFQIEKKWLDNTNRFSLSIFSKLEGTDSS